MPKPRFPVSPGRPRLADVLPITAPARSELWRRHQLARSVLAHREPTTETLAILRRILDGETIDVLAAREIG